jgi:ribosomal protein S18 acetylase RimI-like enzyme
MSETTGGLSIRRATPEDREALFDICLKTADSGVDATELYSDPRLPGYIWAVPYGVFEPDFAFILADGERALGYVIGAPDTLAFERRLEAEWWPEVRRAVAGITPSRPHDAMALERISTPEGHAEWLLADYPAHLHINVLPEAQSGGWGRRLIETELEAMRAAGVRGVHLGVSPTNLRAQGFYRHIGLADLSRDGKVTFGKRFG